MLFQQYNQVNKKHLFTNNSCKDVVLSVCHALNKMFLKLNNVAAIYKFTSKL